MRLYDYQSECLHEIDWFHGRALLGIDCGLGKTAISLSYLKQHPACFPCVIICPASLKYQWRREAKIWTGLKAFIAEGTNPDEAILNKPPKISIINYDILFKRKSKKRVDKGKSWTDFLKQLKPNLIVIDECQRIGGRSKCSAAVKELCRGVPSILALSGTPFTSKPIEIFPVLNILKPNVFSSKLLFAERYCDPRWTLFGMKYDGLSHGNELHDLLLENALVRRRMIDVLPELPEQIDEMIPVPISNEMDYMQADEDLIQWLQEIDLAKAERASKAVEFSKIGYLLQLAAKGKIPYLIEWVNNFLEESDEKLVVFATHREMLNALQEGCQAKSIMIHGGVTGKDRDKAVEVFRSDNRVRVCFANIRAAGTGLDGLQVANNVLLAELDWAPGKIKQAIHRCYRIGTKKTVIAYWVVAEGTIEERICELLQLKQEYFSKVLDGGKEEGDFEVYNMLLREMKRESKKRRK